MRWKLLALLVVASALAAPSSAFADGAPNPAAACKAEYVQLGADAFKAKYGATEPYAACLAAHGGTTTKPPATKPTPAQPASGPEAACRAEYVQLGAAAFGAKYGTKEAFGACVKAHTTTPKSGSAGSAGMAASVAQALCTAEGRSLGKDAFRAKYGQGRDGLAACVKAALGRAQSILTACASGTSGDAFKQCLLAALEGARAR